MTDIPVLAPDYYLQNFTFLLDWVAKRYADLLDPEEVSFVQAFHSLGKDSRCLLVRLMSRKGPCFRAEKLDYPEIGDIATAASHLIDAGMVTSNTLLDMASLASLLTKPELDALFAGHLSGHKSKRKEEWIALLTQKCPVEKTWREWTGGKWGELYQVQQASLINRLLLLFFGNPHQDLSEFVLQDLGLIRYEQYEIDHAHRLFSSRDDIYQYQLFTRLVELFDTSDTEQDLVNILDQIPCTYSSASMERRFARLVNQIAYHLERMGDTERALSLYQRHRYPPAREREIRILERRGECQTAWQLLCEMLQKPGSEEELQIAQRMAPRLARKVKADYSPHKKPGLNERYIELPRATDETGDLLCVEECARRYFAKEDAPCVYVENHLLCGLLGVWLWPELYRSIDGAFANPFQFAPLDFYHEGFQERRPEIKVLWDELTEGKHHDRLQKTFIAKQGIANPLINWQILDEQLLLLALGCIPAKDLRAIFQRMLFDLKRNTSGLPDLIQFFPSQQTYKLIEVKGPGDRIQDNQQRWMTYFQEHGIPAEVCYVGWIR
jgi:hypothetical protein